MRGKVHKNDRIAQFRRITPAYAGKRVRVILTLKQNRDHPRVCGEKI